MKILSIDYGVSTGVAIGNLEGSELQKVYLDTLRNSAEWRNPDISPEACDCVILEKAPFGATWNTSAIFYNLLHYLQNVGFSEVVGLNERGIWLIQPSQWKPFVKKQNLDLASWSPKTKHEQDAMCMLWYAVSMHNKKEKYVFK